MAQVPAPAAADLMTTSLEDLGWTIGSNLGEIKLVKAFDLARLKADEVEQQFRLWAISPSTSPCHGYTWRSRPTATTTAPRTVDGATDGGTSSLPSGAGRYRGVSTSTATTPSRPWLSGSGLSASGWTTHGTSGNSVRSQCVAQ